MDTTLQLINPTASKSKKVGKPKRSFSTEYICPDTSHETAVIPHAIIHPTKIVFYKEFKNSRKHQPVIDNELNDNEASEMNQSFLKSTRKNNGFLSGHAKRKLFKAIDYMIATSIKKKVYSKQQQKYITFRVVFITLTLPSKQQHTDKEITNKLLNQFLLEIQKYHNVKRYVWRAEKQENGNIHYHLLINEFIEYQELRKRWNRICNKLNYVDHYQTEQKEFFKNGFRITENVNDKRSIEQQRKAFIIGQKSDWTSPNSTDIHNTRKIKNIRHYVGKYMAKQPAVNLDSLESEIDIPIVNCRLWSCSHDISSAKGLDLIVDWELSTEFAAISERTKAYFYSADYFKVLYLNTLNIALHKSQLLFERFSQYIYEQFSIPINLKLAI